MCVIDETAYQNGLSAIWCLLYIVAAIFEVLRVWISLTWKAEYNIGGFVKKDSINTIHRDRRATAHLNPPSTQDSLHVCPPQYLCSRFRFTSHDFTLSHTLLCQESSLLTAAARTLHTITPYPTPAPHT